MDWFERITGFRESDYRSTQAKFVVEERVLRSLANGRSFQIGELEVVSLGELRSRLADQGGSGGRLRFSTVVGNVRELHLSPEYAGAIFQVASQFNLLEMTGPSVTPEDGVTRYAYDPTQGPACAIAAGAATIYRNYFAPVQGQTGQTRGVQIDALADLRARLAIDLGRSESSLWSMRNGYALPSRESVQAISRHIRSLEEADRDFLRSLVRIGVHRDVEVTDAPIAPGPVVSQAFCSALPISYAGLPDADWEPFAKLVLDAAYEATLTEGALNARRGKSSKVLLTRLGGGAFGNEPAWIDQAILRAQKLFANVDLDLRMVQFPYSGKPGLSACKFR